MFSCCYKWHHCDI